MVKPRTHIARRTHIVALAVATTISCAATANATARDAIPAQVSPTHIEMGQTVRYSVEVEGDVANVMPPSTVDFQVVGRSTGTSMTFINGRMQRTISATWTLAPTRTGMLNTGSATVLYNDGTSARTTSHNVTVAETQQAPNAPPATTAAPGQMPAIPGVTSRTLPGAQTPTGPAATSQTPAQTPAPLTRTLPQRTGSNTPILPPPLSEALFSNTDGIDGSRPFVVAYTSARTGVLGEPILIEYVYFAPLLGLGYDASDLSEPAFVNAWFRDITEQRTPRGQRLSDVMIGSQRFSAQLVRSYMVVPLDDGAFQVAPLTLTIEGRSFSRRTAPVPIASPPMEIAISTPPEEGRPYPRARAVGRFTVEASVTPTHAAPGDIIHVDIEISGVGTPNHGQIPEYTPPEGFRAFSPNDHAENEVTATGWVHTTLKRTLSFQASQAGEFVFPGVRFAWYDPWKSRWEEAHSEDTRVVIEGEPAASLNEPAPEPNSETTRSWTESLPDPNHLSNELGPIARMRASEPWTGSKLYYFLFVLPLALTGAWVGGQRFRQRREQTREERARKRAGTTASAQLRRITYTSVDDFSALAKSLRGYLALRISNQILGSTIHELRAIVRDAREQKDADHVAALVERAETARYGGGSEDDFRALQAEIAQWIREDEANG